MRPTNLRPQSVLGDAAHLLHSESIIGRSERHLASKGLGQINIVNPNIYDPRGVLAAKIGLACCATVKASPLKSWAPTTVLLTIDAEHCHSRELMLVEIVRLLRVRGLELHSVLAYGDEGRA